MFCLSTDVSRLRRPRAELERDASDALDLGRAIDHRVDGLVDAVDATLLLRLTVVDAAGQLAHDDQIEPAHELGLERRRVFETREDAHRTQVGEEFVVAAQQEQRVLRALRQRLCRRIAEGRRCRKGSPRCARRARASLGGSAGSRRAPARRRRRAPSTHRDVGTNVRAAPSTAARVTSGPMPSPGRTATVSFIGTES